jgi:hypothetical protein
MNKPAWWLPGRFFVGSVVFRRIMIYAGGPATILINKYFADKAPVMGQIAGPEEIEASYGLRAEVHPDLVGPGQGGRRFLYDLAGRVDQLKEEPARLVAVELEQQAVGGRVGIGLIADIVCVTVVRINDDDLRIAYIPRAIGFFDPEIELPHISRIKVVLILVF